MGQIEVDGDAYDTARQALSTAAQTLNEAAGKLGTAVPPLAFGALGAFIPPGFNALGALMEGASAVVSARADTSADGIRTAVSEFENVDDDARADFDKLMGEL